MSKMSTLFVVSAVAVAAPSLARADHAGMAMAASDDMTTSSYSASVSVLAAQFDTVFYSGSYQAVTPSLGWSRGIFAVTASVPIYHLVENNIDHDGPGDAVVGGMATLYDAGPRQAGLALMMSAPTGATSEMLGMGHFMAMPSTWGAWRVGPVTFHAAVGFSRALSSIDDMTVVIGGVKHVMVMPLVEPMNMSELSWGGGAGIECGHGVQVGGRMAGGVPVGAPGTDRVVGALRVQWMGRRLQTSAELQAGLVGDPYTFRGVVETALRF
jgi:hypothetical protein